MFEHDPLYTASRHSTYALKAKNAANPSLFDFSNGEITDAWDAQSITLQTAD